MKTGDRMNKGLRTIPIKNYIIVVIIFIITVIFLAYFVFCYKKSLEYQKNNSVLSGYLAEINEDKLLDNLTNYLVDNPNTLLYISYGNDATIKDFENDFKDLISKHNVRSSFIYIDLNTVLDKNFIFSLQDGFFSEELKEKNIELKRQSNIFIFDQGKIIDVLYGYEEAINLMDVKIFLMRHEVIAND